LDKIVTMPEVADLLQTNVDTLRYWRHKGIGPRSFRVGRRVVYRVSEIEAWLARQQENDGTARGATTGNSTGVGHG
jgi:predicted DNA-binding transcriptional regulator AlpA